MKFEAGCCCQWREPGLIPGEDIFYFCCDGALFRVTRDAIIRYEAERNIIISPETPIAAIFLSMPPDRVSDGHCVKSGQNVYFNHFTHPQEPEAKEREIKRLEDIRKHLEMFPPRRAS